MELKTKYQYTYFIYPYIVEEKNYEKYLYKLLMDQNYTMKIFEKEKDFDLYEYFLPVIRSTMFWSIDYDSTRMKKLAQIDKKMQANMISKNTCTIFTYNLKKDIQGKMENSEDGIYFNIANIEIVCFNTGVCFLLLKTNIEGKNTLTDVCNFNYKFRSIKASKYNLKDYENIKIQTGMFSNIKEINTLIKDITGNNKGAKELNIDTEKFITYSYACIEQEDWNESTNKQLFEKEFYKFANVKKADDQVMLGEKNIEEKMLLIEGEKYEIYGISNVATVLLTNDHISANYTKVPHDFERKYLYNYIFELYKKIHLKQINHEFKQSGKFRKLKERFVNFTQKVWIEETTNEQIGSMLDIEWRNILNLNVLYAEVKEKYDVLYKNTNIEKTAKTNKAIVSILALLLLLNFIIVIKMFL